MSIPAAARPPAPAPETRVEGFGAGFYDPCFALAAPGSPEDGGQRPFVPPHKMMELQLKNSAPALVAAGCDCAVCGGPVMGQPQGEALGWGGAPVLTPLSPAQAAHRQRLGAWAGQPGAGAAVLCRAPCFCGATPPPPRADWQTPSPPRAG